MAACCVFGKSEPCIHGKSTLSLTLRSACAWFISANWSAVMVRKGTSGVELGWSGNCEGSVERPYAGRVHSGFAWRRRMYVELRWRACVLLAADGAVEL